VDAIKAVVAKAIISNSWCLGEYAERVPLFAETLKGDNTNSPYRHLSVIFGGDYATETNILRHRSHKLNDSK
jgi:hypothetical protein